jgi:hypothetical protein
MGGKLVGCAVGVAMLAVAQGACAQSTKRAEKLQLRVLVVNRAGARPEVVQAAERDAAAIYAAAGIQTIWINPAPGGTSIHDMDLTVVLRPESAAFASTKITDTTLGYAVTEPGLPGQRGRLVWVFFGRVEKYAERNHIQISRLCGLVMAHEIGHLVLPAGHTESGLMRATWDLRSGLLQFFNSQQRNEIHARLALARADLADRN